MPNIFDIINSYEARTGNGSHNLSKMEMIENYIAINRLEGLYADELDRRIYQLVADEKVSTEEYVELCKEVAYFKTEKQKK